MKARISSWLLMDKYRFWQQYAECICLLWQWLNWMAWISWMRLSINKGNSCLLINYPAILVFKIIIYLFHWGGKKSGRSREREWESRPQLLRGCSLFLFLFPFFFHFFFISLTFLVHFLVPFSFSRNSLKKKRKKRWVIQKVSRVLSAFFCPFSTQSCNRIELMSSTLI